MGLAIRKISREFDFLLITGDPYILFFTSLFTNIKKEKKIFIGLLQSEWYDSKKPFKLHYSFPERLWLKWFSSFVIVRDHKTKEYLNSKGLSQVDSFGNPMMDSFHIRNERIFPKEKTLIGILPGSKKEAYDSFKVIIEIIKLLDQLGNGEFKFLFAVALSPNLDIRLIEKRYNLIKVKKHDLSSDNNKNAYDLYGIKDCNANLAVSKELFGNILWESKAVIGLSGTGNEQAVGLEKPVFAFWGRGPQITKKYLVAQKKLLGASLFIFPPDPTVISRKIIATMRDKELLSRIAENGKMRMAGRGSVEKITFAIDGYIKNR
jgi:uncharacterized protein (TIGR03492 family)